MTVTKYRSVEEMPRPGRAENDRLLARIRAVWERARALAPPRELRRGVRRFRSLEEANAAQSAETLERMRASRGPSEAP